MEQQKDITQMLNLISAPAFCVQEGTITDANTEALRHVQIGDSVKKLLVTGVQEYKDFQGGCLSLTMDLSGAHCSVSVTKMDDRDVFVLNEDAEQSQLQAMALAAQELRDPLSNVMCVADSLFPMPEFSDNPTASDLAARINRGLLQMLRIVGNMSDAYRYSKEAAPQMEIRDICSLLDEFFAQNAQLIATTGIQLRYTGPEESICCLVDVEKLERAASNLLSNAVKFTEKGGIIDAKLTRKGKMLYLSVTDNGSGIPQNLRNSIYSRFQRQPGVEDGRYGIGLGMVLVRSAASVHGGTVLTEQLPQGTRITMSIPIRQKKDGKVRTPIYRIDYAGERDHKLIELSESLPLNLFQEK